MESSLTIERTKMAKQNKDKAQKPKRNINLKKATSGVFELFVVASVAYSSTVIWLGTDGYISKILVIPAMLWATLKLVQRFAK